MTGAVEVVGGVEYVARGRVEAEKAELLKEIREVVSAGRLEADGDSSLSRTPTRIVPLPAQHNRPSELFLLHALALWFLTGLLVFGGFFSWR